LSEVNEGGRGPERELWERSKMMRLLVVLKSELGMVLVKLLFERSSVVSWVRWPNSEGM
jgi:hypothetical protein